MSCDHLGLATEEQEVSLLVSTSDSSSTIPRLGLHEEYCGERAVAEAIMGIIKAPQDRTAGLDGDEDDY